MDFRLADELNAIREMIDRAIREVCTCVPGNITAFSPGPPARVTVQPALKMQTYLNGVVGYKDYPPVINVPLCLPFASTSGFALTLPISPGDPCLLIFSQKEIANWVDFGGIQPPNNTISSLHHHLSHAFAILAPTIGPGAIGEWDLDGLTIRNRDKTQFVRVRDADVIATAGSSILTLNKDGSGSLACPAGLTLSQDTTINGDLQVNGNINATGTITPGS